MKIGLFAFGGGHAMIPLIEHTCVEKKKWITHDEMMNLTIIAESTPGPISINCATYVGFKQKGLLGAIIATIGMVIPSLVIIFIISLFLDRFLEITWIYNAFLGIKCAVGILIIDAGIKMLKKMDKKPIPIIIVSISFIVMFLIDLFALNISSIILMLVAALLGLVLYFVKKEKQVENEEVEPINDSETLANDENLIVEDGDNNDLS
jgi:chromate transporter